MEKKLFKIDNIILVEKPLNIKYYVDHLNILHLDKILIDIHIVEYENKFNFTFLEEIKILTPLLEKNYYNFSFQKEDNKEFKYLICQINSIFIIFDINFYNDIKIEKNILKNSQIMIQTTNIDNFSIKILYYDKIEDFYKNKISNINNINGIALSIDCNYEKNIDFYKFNEVLKNNISYLILENFNNQDNNESLFLKSKINNLHLIANYDNSIKIDDIPVVKYRNGDLYSDNKHYFIDFLSKEGDEKLKDIYNSFLENNFCGIDLDPIIIKNTHYNAINNLVVRENSIFITYMSNIKKILQKLNNIVENYRKKLIFLTNILTKSLYNFIYIEEIDKNIYTILNNFEQYILQYYNNIGFKIKKRTFLNPKTFFVLIFCKFFIIDYKIVDFLEKNKNLKNIFAEFLDLRHNLKLFRDNLFYNFEEYGIIPFSLFKINNKIKGFFLATNFYVGFLKNIMVEKIFFLPKDRWYCIDSNKILDGNDNTFSYRGNNKFVILFQKENSIVPFYDSTQKNIFQNRIKFYIFVTNDFKINFSENFFLKNNSCEINHNFKILYKENFIKINYISEEKVNLNRFFVFHIVIEDSIKEVTISNKKVFFQKKTHNFIELTVFNKNNDISIEIETN